MTPETIGRDVLSRLNAGDVAGAAAHFADDCKLHQALPEVQGRAGFVQIASKLRAAFPDLHYELVELVADASRVAMVSTVTGTHTGRLAFVQFPIEATGARVKFTQIRVLTIAGDKIVEDHGCTDQAAFLRQLGMKIVQA